MSAPSVILVSIYRSLVTWRDGEMRMNAACVTALLKAWPRAQTTSRHLGSYDEDDVVVYKPSADPVRYLQVRLLFCLLYPSAMYAAYTHDHVAHWGQAQVADRRG